MKRTFTGETSRQATSMIRRALWAAALMLMVSATYAVDSDGDGVDNSIDAFPNDACASVDTDGDGKPNAITPAASCLFEGFESGGFTKHPWVIGGTKVTATVDAVNKRSGLYSAKITNAPLGSNISLKITTQYATEVSIVFFSQNASAPVDFKIDGSGRYSVAWNWGSRNVRTIPAGQHVLEWVASTSSMGGSFWIDDIFITPLIEDTDDDNDGVLDTVDKFPLDPTETVDTDNDGIGNNADTDDDNDGIQDVSDNCPLNSNPGQTDTDGDGLPDACTDTDDDNDGVTDSSDKFPLNPAASVDGDNDGAPTSWNAACDATCQANSGLTLDNCPSKSNSTQANYDGDSQGDACDTDDDNDGVTDISDSFPLDATQTAGNTNFLNTFNGDGASDYFAYSVSGAGDVNGDGYDDVIVGAYADDNNSLTDSGSARVLSGLNGAILYTFNGDSASDQFGYSVSGAGDVNNDGYDDVIVGAYQDDNNGGNSGSARVFSGINGAILYTFNGDNAGDWFGYSVSGAGDVNGDGYADVIVGAIYDDNNGGGSSENSGSARVFSGANGAILYTFNGDSAGDYFGASVASAGDVNNDDYDDVIVGAYADDNNGTESGSARVLSGQTGAILYTLNGDSADDYFGRSVSGAGDVNGDGYADVIVGAYGDDNNGSSSGSARVFSGKGLWTDTDGDGSNDAVDTDDDNDGVLDINDATPRGDGIDTDNDGTINSFDSDDDNDGMPDTWETTYGLNPLVNDASGDLDSDGFTNLQEYTNGTDPTVPEATNKAVNDFNTDGKSDVLFLNSSTAGTQYWSGAVKASTTYPGTYDTSYSYKGAGDFNGDGSADLFFTRASNNGTLIWNGAVKASASYPGTSTAGFSAVAMCDTHGDGEDDVFWYNATTGGTQIWPSATKASVTYPGAQSTAYSVVACGDFDGDGSDDIFWRNNASGANEVWLGGSKTNKLYPGAYTDLTWTVIGAGDVNGNGNDDLLWYKASTGATQIWEGGLKSAATYPGANSTTFTPKAIGDYDGNGSADLLWSNDSTLGTQIWPGVVKASVTYPGTHASGFTIQK